MTHFSRRDALKVLAAGTAVMATGCAARTRSPRAASPVDCPEPDFTFVHLTDMHVRRKRQGHVGYRACIDHVNALDRKPDLALMGGDLAFDGLYTERDEFEDQIALYKSVSDLLHCPYYNCMGNHDALGWSSRRKVPVDDPELGMKMILKRLGMDRTYYSFDHKGWHFFVLDSLFEIETSSGPSYEPRIGEEQLHWLALDLAAAGDRPKVGMVHIAAFCNMGQISGDPEAKAMNHMVVRDNKDLREVLERHGVTALLQGHSHQIEDYYYGGVHYITSPSVSAAWWGGNWRGFEPGYTILNAHADGRLTWHRTTFPWEHQLEPEDTLERQRIAEREAFEAEQKRLRDAERAAARGLAPV